MSESEYSENVESNTSVNRPQRNKRKKSTLWSVFTVVDVANRMAVCNLCGIKLSFKSTITNMRKHLERKHKFDDKKDSFRPNAFKIKQNIGSSEKTITPQKKTLTELGGLDGLLLNVVAEEGDPLGEEEEVEEAVVLDCGTDMGEDVHDYCVTITDQDPLDHPGDTIKETKRTLGTKQGVRYPPRQRNVDVGEKTKRSRIMDLQLECLEIKKYTMQMEALMLEHQLNLPRSFYTETLERSSCVTRGTQTEIGGNNTKVFYVSDSQGSRLNAQFFSFPSRTDD